MPTNKQSYSQDYSTKAPKSVCVCGHTGDGAQSEHEDNLSFGHGRCKADDCDCKQFTWARWTADFKRSLDLVDD